MAKIQTSVCMTDTAKRLMAAMAANLGVSQTAVLEMAIREMAKRKGVKIG